MKKPPATEWTLSIIDFFNTGIWRIRLRDVSRSRAFFIKSLRVVLLSLRKFTRDRCAQMASALTFYSLLSIVPILAMAFGVAKGFGFDKIFERQLYDKFPGHEEVLQFIINFVYSFLENVKGGIIAGIGAAVLLWAVIQVLGNIENSFNTIWEVKKSRPFRRKLSDYLSALMIFPLLVILSSSMTVFITTRITQITQRIEFIGFFSPVIFFFLKLLPYVLIWILFILTYILMPNTRVRFRSGVIAGILAGTVYQLAQWVYITFQIGVSRYNAIYGSFSAFPLFLVWIQLSWYIVLAGAEISYAFQNVDNYELEPDIRHMAPGLKKQLSLQIVHCIVQNFADGRPPLTTSEIAGFLEIPINLAQAILYDLHTCGILSETVMKKGEKTAFQPAVDIRKISISYLLEALDRNGIEEIPIPRTPERQTFSEALKRLADAGEKSPANRLLKDI